MSDTNNTLEILINLIYLAKHSEGNRAKVVEYLDQAESQVLQLAEILQSHKCETSLPESAGA